MSRKLALALIVGSLCSLLVAYASAFGEGGAPDWAAWVMALGTSTLMVSMMALGAMRRSGLGRLAIPFALVLGILVGGFSLALWIPEVDPTDPTLWGGLPPASAVVLYGIGLLPLLAIPLAYAWTFDEMTLSAADLDRVRAAARALREGTPNPVDEPADEPSEVVA